MTTQPSCPILSVFRPIIATANHLLNESAGNTIFIVTSTPMRSLIVLLFVAASLSLSAQNLGKGWKKDKVGQQEFFVAEELFYNQNFLLALEIYRGLEVKYPNADILKFRIGVCLLHKPDEVDQAVVYL